MCKGCARVYKREWARRQRRRPAFRMTARRSNRAYAARNKERLAQMARARYWRDHAKIRARRAAALARKAYWRVRRAA